MLSFSFFIIKSSSKLKTKVNFRKALINNTRIFSVINYCTCMCSLIFYLFLFQIGANVIWSYRKTIFSLTKGITEKLYNLYQKHNT